MSADESPTPVEGAEAVPAPPRRLPGWFRVALVVGLMLASALTGGWVVSALTPRHEPGPAAGSEATTYTCSMHPQVRAPGPGTCPICGMPLVPADGGSGSGSETGLTLTPEALAMARIESTEVRSETVASEIQAFGKVGLDETGLATVVARVDGYVERIHVESTGVDVARGSRLLEIYSPELEAAQQELLLAKRQIPGMVEPARAKLRLLGVSPAEIDAVLAAGVARPRLTVHSPISGTVLSRDVFAGGAVTRGMPLYRVADLRKVWVQLAVYEAQLPSIHVGQEARLTLEALPGRELVGKVAFVNPTLDPATRTVAVRVVVDNRERLLRPELFVRARLIAPDVAHEPRLMVPTTAVIGSGTRNLVYLEEGPGRFRPVAVRLGPRVGDRTVVLEGLQAGQRVASRGVFLLDSQFQIRGLPSLMQPEPDAVGPSRDHAHAPPPAGAAPAAARWVCPMHPEVVRDARERCPICGMWLEPTPMEGDE